jgi:hypothetical protein
MSPKIAPALGAERALGITLALKHACQRRRIASPATSLDPVPGDCEKKCRRGLTQLKAGRL